MDLGYFRHIYCNINWRDILKMQWHGLALCKFSFPFLGDYLVDGILYHKTKIESRLCDTYGPRWLLIGGSVSYLLSLFMTALCTEYWQFFLAQGVLTGLGSGMTYSPHVCG
jgi:MFS family permease